MKVAARRANVLPTVTHDYRNQVPVFQMTNLDHVVMLLQAPRSG